MRKIVILLFLSVGFFLTPPNGNAQHPVEVERAFVQQRYFDALVSFRNLPQRRHTGPLVRMAIESGWAMGLPDEALRNIAYLKQNFSQYVIENPDVYLVEGILLYQEGKWNGAVDTLRFVQESKTVNNDLKGEAFTLHSEIAFRLKDFDLAVAMARKALTFLPPEKMGDARLLMAKSHYEQGHLTEARDSLLDVSPSDRQAWQALRLLTKVALKQESIDEAAILLNEIRHNHPESGADSWLDYTEGQIAIGKNDSKRLLEVLKAVAGHYPESDPWRVMLEAVAEKYLRKKI
jgi:tetratricopeptide (TPR) repeat protein